MNEMQMQNKIATYILSAPKLVSTLCGYKIPWVILSLAKMNEIGYMHCVQGYNASDYVMVIFKQIYEKISIKAKIN